MQHRLWRRMGWISAGLLALVALALGGRPTQAQDAQWFGQFWNNRNLSGPAAMVRWENSIDFNWFGGSPDPLINSDDFSARWTRTVNFPAGTYRFFATMDDGMRVWIDNQLVIDSWTESQEHTMTVDRAMNGNHNIRVEFFEAGGMATARFWWEPISSGSGTPFFPNWQAEYFNTPNLAGAPVLVRDDRYVNNNWGTASPGPGVNADFWSVRWTRQITAQPGTWTIQLTSDDGSRIFINNQLVLDNWFDARPFTASVNYFNTGATLNVRVEFYDSSGPAFIQVNLIPPTGSTGGTGGGTGGGGTSGGSCVTTPSGLQAQNIATTALNIRRGPSQQFEVMGSLAPCQIVPLSGFRNADSTWVQIVTTNGQTGWVSAQYVRLGVPISSLTPTN